MLLDALSAARGSGLTLMAALIYGLVLSPSSPAQPAPPTPTHPHTPAPTPSPTPTLTHMLPVPLQVAVPAHRHPERNCTSFRGFNAATASTAATPAVAAVGDGGGWPPSVERRRRWGLTLGSGAALGEPIGNRIVTGERGRAKRLSCTAGSQRGLGWRSCRIDSGAAVTTH